MDVEDNAVRSLRAAQLDFRHWEAWSKEKVFAMAWVGEWVVKETDLFFKICRGPGLEVALRLLPALSCFANKLEVRIDPSLSQGTEETRHVRACVHDKAAVNDIPSIATGTLALAYTTEAIKLRDSVQNQTWWTITYLLKFCSIWWVRRCPFI